MALTRKSKKILLFIHSFIKEQGIAPTYQEILNHIGSKSRGSMNNTINRMIRDGYLTRDNYRARGLKVCKMPPDHQEPQLIEGEHATVKYRGMDIFVSERVPDNTMWVSPATFVQLGRSM